ncbi:MAG TPA: hypothetical protein VGI23_21120 [Steroidobacteraceae bacterium]|jgi:methylenetetrahydrofolate reductase (NADPH)
MNTMLAPSSPDALKRSVMDFMRRASAEVSTHDEELLPALVNRLPRGITLYVAHTSKASLDDVVRVAVRIESLGFRASPHIVARRLESERALKDALRDLRDGGVEQLLLVAGDRPIPVGKFASTIDVLETGAIVGADFKRVGVCGHPEGHKAIGPTALWNALHDKQALAKRLGLNLHIVSQFGFDPRAVCAWDRCLAQHGVFLPVHVGIAGPTPLPKLTKFAMQCGIATSLHALVRNLSAASNLVQLATSPDEMVIGLVRGRAMHRDTRLLLPHFYSLGGAVATARWIRAVLEGNFEVHPDSGKFLLRA